MGGKSAMGNIFKGGEIALPGGGKWSFITAGGSASEACRLLEGFCGKEEGGGNTFIGPEIYGMRELPIHGIKYCGRVDFKGTYEEGESVFCGLQACVLSGVPSREIVLDGESLGAVFEDEYARYALLGGIFPDNLRSCRGAQTVRVFEKMEAALKYAGMDFSNVVRTWFYNSKILSWYEEFNRVRDEFFESRNVFASFVPASTGIGSANVKNAALTARAFAVLPKCGKVKIREIASPLQCSALDYRSSFSRAAEVSHPNFRHLLVSGTAGIAPGGETAFRGNFNRQMNLSLDVVEAILESCGMDWPDCVRAVAYIKDSSHLPDFDKIRKQRGLKDIPCVIVQADICRDDLLFEMELDALVNKKHSGE